MILFEIDNASLIVNYPVYYNNVELYNCQALSRKMMYFLKDPGFWILDLEKFSLCWHLIFYLFLVVIKCPIHDHFLILYCEHELCIVRN